MRFRISRHARGELRRRRIPRAILDSVVESPEQVVPAHGGKHAYQSRVNFGGRVFLVRAIVDDSVDPATVITAYRTTKIDKYWSRE